MAGRTARLLLANDTRWPRRQALDATTAWGHGTTGLARPGDDDRDPDLPSASWPLGDDRDPDLPSASWPLGD
ncbi:hypothetical protein, partial [Kitasatospora indigofera]|uniref:hypothetical protein n=1 Tax=Kitasatospora indigofera TaxID=67307 RepID=UPI0036B56B84